MCIQHPQSESLITATWNVRIETSRRVGRKGLLVSPPPLNMRGFATTFFFHPKPQNRMLRWQFQLLHRNVHRMQKTELPRKRAFWKENYGSQELQREDQGVPLSLWYESRVNSVKYLATPRTFFIFIVKRALFRGNSVSAHFHPCAGTSTVACSLTFRARLLVADLGA